MYPMKFMRSENDCEDSCETCDPLVDSEPVLSSGARGAQRTAGERETLQNPDPGLGWVRIHVTATTTDTAPSALCVIPPLPRPRVPSPPPSTFLGCRRLTFDKQSSDRSSAAFDSFHEHHLPHMLTRLSWGQ